MVLINANMCIILFLVVTIDPISLAAIVLDSMSDSKTNTLHSILTEALCFCQEEYPEQKCYTNLQ